MSNYEIVQADVIEWAKNYTGEKFHAAFMDPPYHLSSIHKRFSKPNSKPAAMDVYRRASKGFMNVDWDGGGISFQPETWAALAEHLYPGAFGMAFASPRNQHRMACAIEDAGLIIHPTIWLWNYLSGFPKATRIKGYGSPAFKGHRYGLQALKPAAEPIICFQKPYEGRPVDSIVATGAGALWIDGGRIGTREANESGWSRSGSRASDNRSMSGPNYERGPKDEIGLGRWPANFTLTHHPNCNGECVPDCPVAALDRQSGILHSGGADGHRKATGRTDWGMNAKHEHETEGGLPSDSGPASRMFHRSGWEYEVAEQLANAQPVRYEPKASSAEREAGLDRLETKTRHRVNAGGLENEPRFAPVQAKNHHPTVKPISLTKYLATLLLPPAGYHRRILCPFAGSGSEMIGAILAGWDEVTGIEKYPLPDKPISQENPDYIGIAEARLKWWSQWPGWGQTDVDAILAASTKEEDAGQLPLFAPFDKAQDVPGGLAGRDKT